MRRSYDAKKLARHKRKPAELLLVPMIDIFTVLVTFLLMTAVFSRTVVLELDLPAQQRPEDFDQVLLVAHPPDEPTIPHAQSVINSIEILSRLHLTHHYDVM